MCATARRVLYVRGVDRPKLVWTLVAFFGASVVFRAIQSLTADASTLTTVAAQGVALAVIIVVIFVVVRRRG